MLWAAVLGEVLALDDELPNKLNDQQARSEELSEQPHLRQPSTDATLRPVLDVPGDGPEVGHWLVADALNDVDGGGMSIKWRAGGGGGEEGGRSSANYYYERERGGRQGLVAWGCVCVCLFFRTARIHAEHAVVQVPLSYS